MAAPKVVQDESSYSAGSLISCCTFSEMHPARNSSEGLLQVYRGLTVLRIMETRGKLLPEEIKEAGRMLRSRWYWPKLLLRSWYGGLLFIALVWGTVLKVVSGDREHWLGLSVVWLVVIAIICWATVSTKRTQRQAVQVLDASLPDKLSFGDDGVSAMSADGSRSFRPWSSFKNWRNGRALLLLTLAETKGAVMVPLSDLSGDQQDALRDILQRHIDHKL